MRSLKYNINNLIIKMLIMLILFCQMKNQFLFIDKSNWNLRHTNIFIQLILFRNQNSKRRLFNCFFYFPPIIFFKITRNIKRIIQLLLKFRNLKILLPKKRNQPLTYNRKHQYLNERERED
jgi:hypothetical protein